MTLSNADAARSIGPNALTRAVLQIRDTLGEPVGIGFLVDTDLAITCAHVVAAALGLSDGAEPTPEQSISVVLPLLPASGDRVAVQGHVEHWIPSAPSGGGDVAVLRLAAALPGAKPIRLLEASEVWGHSARAYGFPAGRSGGVWHSGVLRARQANGWVQADLAAKGYRVSEGFSGSPVWDDELGGVVGMIAVAESGDPPVSYLIPTQGLTAAWPRLAELTRPPASLRKRRRRLAVAIASAVIAALVTVAATLFDSANGSAARGTPMTSPTTATVSPTAAASGSPTPSPPRSSTSSSAPPPAAPVSQSSPAPKPTPTPTPSPTGAPPGPITGMNSGRINVGYTQTVTVRWNPQEDATSFDVHYTTSGSAQHESVDTITNTTTPSYDFTAYQGETSCMYVRARNKYGVSAWDTAGTHCFTV